MVEAEDVLNRRAVGGKIDGGQTFVEIGEIRLGENRNAPGLFCGLHFQQRAQNLMYRDFSLDHFGLGTQKQRVTMRGPQLERLRRRRVEAQQQLLYMIASPPGFFAHLADSIGVDQLLRLRGG